MSSASAAVFEIVSWTAALVIFALVIRDAVRRRRVTPTLAMSIALGSIFWMEAPYDWATWCQFHPALPRIPAWGPLGMTSGGLPWLAPVGYVMYNVVPVIGAVALAKRLAGSMSLNPIRTLLATAFVVGFFWDLAFEIFGSRMGWWRYSRGIPGFTLWEGTPYTFSLTISFFMATLFTVCAWLIGRRDADDFAPLERWAAKRVSPGWSAGVLHVVATVVVVQLTFALLFLPNLIAKLAGLHTAPPPDGLFVGLSPQPGALSNAPVWYGGAVVLGMTALVLGLFVGAVLRLDPQAGSRTLATAR